MDREQFLARVSELRTLNRRPQDPFKCITVAADSLIDYEMPNSTGAQEEATLTPLEPTRVTQSQQALEAWKRRFTDRQVKLNPEDPPPFVPGRFLGSGGLGVVYETSIDGIAVAWKRQFSRKLTQWHLNEAEILTHLSEQRHRHIVELVGSYIHRQKGIYELGLILWPVAQCDLAFFLQEIDSLWSKVSDDAINQETSPESVLDAIETLGEVLGVNVSSHYWMSRRTHLSIEARRRLREIFGCATEAVAYLHRNGVRHKDIKPSQILLTRDGMWLTDFGWSKNVSEMTNSLTSSGDTITIRYHAPERANMQSCGRSEDIFSLGCTFLEMTHRLSSLGSSEYPIAKKGTWSYQANLEEVRQWIKSLQDNLHEEDKFLADLVSAMLITDPDRRITIEAVLNAFNSTEKSLSFFSKCCSKLPDSSLRHHGKKSSIHDLLEPKISSEDVKIISYKEDIGFEQYLRCPVAACETKHGGRGWCTSLRAEGIQAVYDHLHESHNIYVSMQCTFCSLFGLQFTEWELDHQYHDAVVHSLTRKQRLVTIWRFLYSTIFYHESEAIPNPWDTGLDDRSPTTHSGSTQDVSSIY